MENFHIGYFSTTATICSVLLAWELEIETNNIY